MTRIAVGERADLLELERDEQDRRGPRRAPRPAGGGRTRSRRRRARASAARRSAPRVAGDLAREHDLLLVAARERAGRASRARRRARRTRSSSAARPLDQPPRREPAEARVRRLAVVVQGEVLGEREVEHEPAALAVLGDVADAGVERARARSRAGDVARRRRDRPARRPAQPGDRLDQLASGRCRRRRRCRRSRPRAPRTTTPRTASSPRSSTHVRDPRPRAAARPACAGAFSTRSSTSRPTISSRERLPRSRPRSARVSIFLPRRSTVIAVGDLEHLVQLVADEDDRHALARSACAGSRTAPSPPAASAPRSARRGSRMSAPR